MCRMLVFVFYLFFCGYIFTMSKINTIAIVGNSPVLLDKEYGAEIDSHDMVIRFNNFKIEGYEIYTGKKTTHVCFNAYTLFNENILSFSKEQRLFFYTTESDEKLTNLLNEKYHGKLSLDDVTIIDNNIYYKELCEKLNAENNWQGSSGLIMCQMMVDKFPNAQIDVYGITFFKDVIKKKDGERYHKIHHYDGTISNSGHDCEAEWKYYETYLKNTINLHF